MKEQEPMERCPACGFEGKVVDEESGLVAWGKNGQCLECGHSYGPEDLDLDDVDPDDWKEDTIFMKYARENWAVDLERVEMKGTWRQSATGRMRMRFQGWNAALRATRDAYLRAATGRS